LPDQGHFVAIDAEFVSLKPEESETRADGKKVVTQPGRFSLARVSVIQAQHAQQQQFSHNILGGLDMSQEPLIDDYIATPEPIADYLTRFSGIKPGDLDPELSPHHLTTLKSAYLKLRYLVDKGCYFVGHGLKKDFRIINILVPPHQVFDTVELFHLKRQRKLSLKFLASFLLNIDIQTKTHCSVEDARTALALYNVYIKLVQDGTLEQILHKIYHVGRMSNWHNGQSLGKECANLVTYPLFIEHSENTTENTSNDTVKHLSL